MSSITHSGGTINQETISSLIDLVRLQKFTLSYTHRGYPVVLLCVKNVVCKKWGFVTLLIDLCPLPPKNKQTNKKNKKQKQNKTIVYKNHIFTNWKTWWVFQFQIFYLKKVDFIYCEKNMAYCGKVYQLLLSFFIPLFLISPLSMIMHWNKGDWKQLI